MMRKHLALPLLVCALGWPASALAKPAEGSGATPITKLGKKARAPKEKAPCYAPEVHVVRRRGAEVEHRHLSLTMCDGTVNPAALDSVSVLARPRDAERPSLAEIKAYQRRPTDRGPQAKRRNPAFLSQHVMRVHPGLLQRLQRVAQRWPGKTIEIISGHRPDARTTSRHHHGRALDMRVEGVSREALRDFLRKFDETGVGYYPNSYFVHMDVREDRGYWVDRSGPGEAPDYGRWPPPKREIDQMSAKVVRGALAELDALRGSLVSTSAQSDLQRAAAEANVSIEEDEGEGEERALPSRPMRSELVRSAEPAALPKPARRTAKRPQDATREEDLNQETIEQIRKQALDAIRGL